MGNSWQMVRVTFNKPNNENDGQSTIELYSRNDNGNQECIWDNSYESEIKRKNEQSTIQN